MKQRNVDIICKWEAGMFVDLKHKRWWILARTSHGNLQCFLEHSRRNSETAGAQTNMLDTPMLVYECNHRLRLSR